MYYNLNTKSKDLTSVLSTETDNIKERVKKQGISGKKEESKTKLEDLEKQLNELFYGKEDNLVKSHYNEYLDWYLKAAEGTIKQKIDEHDFNKIDKFSEILESKTIKISTLMNDIQYLENLINEGKLANISNIIEEAKEILTQEANKTFFGEKDYIELKEKNDIKIVNRVKALKNFLNQKNVKSQKDFGDFFEKALALVNVGIDGMTQEDAEELIFGAINVKRGDITTVVQEIDKKFYNEKENPGFELKDGRYVIKYNPSQKRQGKMDVLIKFDDNLNNGFRISAKNWSNGTGDLGTTNIEYGINRIGSQESVYAYKYGLLLNDENKLNTVHDFAKLALKADIAMGLSQTYGENNGLGGYANVLVINDGKHIYVKDLRDIVYSAPLQGYDTSEISLEAQKIIKNMKNLRKRRSENYIGLITSYLFKVFVTINLNVNTLDKIEAPEEIANTYI